MADRGTPSSAYDNHNHNNSSNNNNNNAHITGPNVQRSVKRPRPVKSCIECRKRKLKCDRLCPCSQCQKSHRNCRYAADGDAANLSDASDEGTPERASKKSCAPFDNEPVTKGHDRTLDGAPTVALDDYGSRLDRLEKLILSSSKPPFPKDFGPRTQPLIPSSSFTIRGLTAKGGLRTRFFGQNSTRVLLNLFDDAKEFMFSRHKPADLRETFANIQKIHKTLVEEQVKALTPITVYVDSITPIQKRMADILPKRAVCDQLLHVFITGSESLYRSVHIPTFMEQYERWWDGSLRSEVFLPQLLPMLCIGYRFIGAARGLQPDRDGIHIPTACSLVREFLNGLRGKHLVDFGTLQAETLLLMAQRMVNPKNHDSWTQSGLIVRMAMTMGLHRDPSEFPQKISPFWGELRRRIWYTILELDLQMCIQCNMPACIREGDYTCRTPRNINDADLYMDMKELPESKPIDYPTDSQIQVFAASTLSIRFKVVDLINRLDSLTDYQQVLDCGNELERVFDDVRYILLRKQFSNPEEAARQWMTKTILDMHCRRAHLALYRPFALSTPDAPPQILTAYLRSSVTLLAYMDDLDPTNINYSKVFHLYHLVLKQDILQASFSVCYYIQNATVPANDGTSPHSYSSPRAGIPEEAFTIATESSMLLSRPRLISAVEKSLDAMNSRIREIGTDMKDLVSLTVVLALCQGGTPEMKRERAHKGLRAIVEAGLQSIHSTQDNIGSIPMMPQTPMSMNSLGTPSGFLNPVQPFMMSQEIPNVIPDDFVMWDMEFWSPLLQNGSI